MPPDPSSSTASVDRLLARKTQLEAARQRDIVVVEGSADFTDRMQDLLTQRIDSYLLFSNRLPNAVPDEQAGTCLGRETDWVIVDLQASLDVGRPC